MKTCTMERIEKHADNIKLGNEKVKPGEAARFTEASVAGDCLAQGDLYLCIYEGKPPTGYVLVEKPTEQDKQLVPGNTQGSKHCLDSLDGVKLYRPENWTGDDLRGPLLVLSEERTVLHPTHGDVTIPAGFSVLCGYQPDYDFQTKQEWRNAD